MAEVTQQQVVDYIKGISVLELSQLVKTLETERGDLADDLDDVDLVAADFGQRHGEVGLLLGRSDQEEVRGSRGKGRNQVVRISDCGMRMWAVD